MAELVTLADVRTALELPAADDTRDALIEELIPAVTAAVEDLCEREFVNRPTLTRSFRWIPGAPVDLCPRDLRTITSVEVEGETLTADTDFRGDPFERKHGVYTSLLIRKDWTPTDTTYFDVWGFHRVEVTGDWGFATVPEPVKRAAAITVASWTNTEVGSVGLGRDLDEPRFVQPQVQKTYAIPSAAYRLLLPFMRFTVI